MILGEWDASMDSEDRQTRDLPRQLQVQPHHPILPDREVRRMQRLRLEKSKHRAVHLQPLRLRHVEHKDGRAVSVREHVAEQGVVFFGRSTTTYDAE